MRDNAIEQLRRTIHEHHWHNLEILRKKQEELKEQIRRLQQCRQGDGWELDRFVREA